MVACVASVSYWVTARKLEQGQKKMEGGRGGKKGNACPQTPRFWKTPLEISQFVLFVNWQLVNTIDNEQITRFEKFTILTAYIISASQNLSYILQIPPRFVSSGQVWCFAVSLLKFSCFALIVVIFPAFRWRKLLSPHPPPLVPVDAATLNSRCIP